MKNILLFSVFSVVALFGCNLNDGISPATNATISAELNWTPDVSSVNMTEVGIASTEVTSGSVFALQNGKGTISWVSDGVEHSTTVDIGGVEEGAGDDVVCEQEGEYQGENVGCVLQFSFSGDKLSIQ